MTIPKPLDPATEALLQRLDAGYAGIDPDDTTTDPPAWKPFWEALLRDYSDASEVQEGEAA